MTEIISIRGMDILQKDYQQVVIRGNGDEQFNQVTNKYLSLQPPTIFYLLKVLLINGI